MPSRVDLFDCEQTLKLVLFGIVMSICLWCVQKDCSVRNYFRRIFGEYKLILKVNMLNKNVFHFLLKLIFILIWKEVVILKVYDKKICKLIEILFLSLQL